MKNILVPTDFTEIAERGLKVAVNLAKHSKAEIHLMNVIYPVRGTTFSAYGDINNIPKTQEDRFMAELVRKNEQRMESLIAEYEASGVNIHPVFDFEDKVNGINAFVKENDVDLVVIGTTGSTSLSEYFFGSNTEKLIKASECPVISVRQEVTDFYPRNIIFAVDVENELYSGSEYIREFADKYNSTVHLVYVINDGIKTDTAVKKLEKFASDYNFSDYSINTIPDDSPEISIRKFAKRKKADMLSMISHGRKGLSSHIFGSVTNEVLNDSEIPVLVVNKDIS